MHGQASAVHQALHSQHAALELRDRAGEPGRVTVLPGQGLHAGWRSSPGLKLLAGHGCAACSVAFQKWPGAFTAVMQGSSRQDG
jgi:hypothetical protein